MVFELTTSGLRTRNFDGKIQFHANYLQVCHSRNTKEKWIAELEIWRQDVGGALITRGWHVTGDEWSKREEHARSEIFEFKIPKLFLTQMRFELVIWWWHEPVGWTTWRVVEKMFDILAANWIRTSDVELENVEVISAAGIGCRDLQLDCTKEQVV